MARFQLRVNVGIRLITRRSENNCKREREKTMQRGEKIDKRKSVELKRKENEEKLRDKQIKELNGITAWSKPFQEVNKLRWVKKFPASCVTRRFITLFKGSGHR
jgi:hypothetical protein